MNNITIVNRYTRIEPAIYCGRGSALGNPFVMKSEADRDKVCDAYDEYLRRKIEEGNNPQCEQLNNIWAKWMKSDIALICFCAPKRCHCETIKAVLIEAYKGEYN